MGCAISSGFHEPAATHDSTKACGEHDSPRNAGRCIVRRNAFIRTVREMPSPNAANESFPARKTNIVGLTAIPRIRCYTCVQPFSLISLLTRRRRTLLSPPSQGVFSEFDLPAGDWRGLCDLGVCAVADVRRDGGERYGPGTGIDRVGIHDSWRGAVVHPKRAD